MTKYSITITYDGSKYEGLQKLKNAKTVQGELESVLSSMNESFVKVSAAGRTDKGVHALEQTCTFELTKKTTPYKLGYYINRSTSKYLWVTSCKVVDDDEFHARFSVKSKTYKYIINTGPYDPIREDYLYNYNKPLEIEKMKEAANIIKGPHDFKAFVTGKHDSTESIVDEITIEKEGEEIIVRVKSKAFYTYMVRNIVSILVLIGAGKLDIKDLKVMLKEKKKVIEYSPAPPGGLYLEKIEY